MRRALYLAPFGELADPRALIEVARVAEEAGWDGIFLWDHMWRPDGRVIGVGDVWISLAGIAAATQQLRLGPMIVPLARRRPQKVARESVSLDLLSSGRLTVGVGLGVDTDRELGRFGEVTDDRQRAARLDEAIHVLRMLWSGEVVQHRGRHFLADDVRFLPVAQQVPRIPLWGAALGSSGDQPVRRAAMLDGIFPWRTSPSQLTRMLEIVAAQRGTLDDFDVAVVARGQDEAAQMLGAGATWLIHALAEDTSLRSAVAAAGDPGILAQR